MTLPEGFDEFWKETAKEALDFNLDFRRREGDAFELAGFRIDTFSFSGIDGEEIHGWISIPHEMEPRAPAFLWIPPYGRESLLPNAYGTRSGFVSLSLNFFGLGPFHQEKYVPERGYFVDGVLDPRTWVFRRMFQNAVL